jgi:plastocyanin
MQLTLLQAVAEQLLALKVAARLAYMVAEAANKAATFDHAFTEAGEYSYFYLLHPNMVGTVRVG